MLVSEAMSRDVIAVPPGTPIVDAVALAAENGIEYLPVVDAGRVLGILAASELMSSRLNRDVALEMHVPVAWVDAGATLEEAVYAMDESDVSCLLAMDGERLVGILTRGDLLRGGLSMEQAVGQRVCSACGSYRHVHRRGTSGLMLCVECSDKATPPRAGEELGVAG